MSIALDAVGHSFVHDHLLFQGMTLRLEPGRSYAVVGPSGAGKSTLLSILAGTTRPTQGTIDRGHVGRTGWVFQNPHGVPRRTALDHAVVPYLARGLERTEAEPLACALLADFTLAQVAKTEFRGLSGGEAQRLMLARAIASEPDLLLVDEPTAQLDLHTAAAVNAVLQNVAGHGSIVVVATHDPGTRDSCTNLIDLADYQG